VARRQPTPLDLEIAAAYAEGDVGLRAVAAKFGVGESQAVGALRRAGVPRRTRSDGQRARAKREAAAEMPPLRREPAVYPWAAEAAARHQSGMSIGGLAAEYDVKWGVMRTAIKGQGITPVSRPRIPPSAMRSPVRRGDALALRRKWSDRIGDLEDRAAESTGEKRAALLARADELTMCEWQLRAVIRSAAAER
jgi:transposase-like protein